MCCFGKIQLFHCTLDVYIPPAGSLNDKKDEASIGDKDEASIGDKDKATIQITAHVLYVMLDLAEAVKHFRLSPHVVNRSVSRGRFLYHF